MSIQLEKILQQTYGSRWKKGRGRRGIEYRICCPFCPKRNGKPDKAFKMYMNPTIDKYNCYKCGARGHLSSLYGTLKSDANTPFQPVKRYKPKNIDMPGDVIPLKQAGYDNVAVQYLRERGFDTDILSDCMGVHYCTSGRTYGDGEDFFFDTTSTIVFPIWMHGKMVGWQSRLLYDPDSLDDLGCTRYGIPKNSEGEWVIPPKYMTPPGVAKSEILYNFDNARKSKVCVVVEGPLDVAGVGMCGIGTFGKGISPEQINMMKSYWDLIVLMLDPDGTDSETQQLVYGLRMSVPVVPVKLVGVNDPGDASFVTIWSQIYDTAARYGHDITKYDLGPYNAAIIRTTNR